MFLFNALSAAANLAGTVLVFMYGGLTSYIYGAFLLLDVGVGGYLIYNQSKNGISNSNLAFYLNVSAEALAFATSLVLFILPGKKIIAAQVVVPSDGTIIPNNIQPSI